MSKNNLRVEKIALRAVPSIDMRSRSILGNGLRGVSRLPDEVHIRESRITQHPLPALALAEEFPRAANLQIALGDREAVVAASNHLQPLPGGFGQFTPEQQDAGALAISPTD